MEKTTSPGHTTTLFNKILIPVLTTVLGATAIYFLGFNKKSDGRSEMEKLLITKEATIKAWKSFVTTQNITNKNTQSLSAEYGEKIAAEVKENGFGKSLVPILSEYKNEITREVNKSSQDIKDIIKKEDIDEGFVSMLNRALDNTKDQVKKAEDLMDALISLAKSDMSNQEKGEKWLKLSENIVAMSEKIEERAANEAEGIAKTLSERYNHTFDLNELDVYVEYKNGKDKKREVPDPAPPDPDAGGGTEIKDPEVNNNNVQDDGPAITTAALTGEWDMTDGSLELAKNGEMFWTFGNKGYTSGTWKLVDGKLHLNATNPDTKKKSLLIGFLSDVTQNSFTMTFMSTPKEVYHFKRAK